MAYIKAKATFKDQIWESVTECSSDFPSDAVGECVTNAVHDAYRDGVDPTGLIVLVTFG